MHTVYYPVCIVLHFLVGSVYGMRLATVHLPSSMMYTFYTHDMSTYLYFSYVLITECVLAPLNDQIYFFFSYSFWLDLMWKKEFVFDKLIIFYIEFEHVENRFEMPVHFVLCIGRHFIDRNAILEGHKIPCIR